jgi:acyl carrier protein
MTVLLKLADSPESEWEELIAQYIQNELYTALGFDSGELVPVDQGFFDLGMESVAAVQFQMNLQKIFQVQLPDTATFDYPNIRELAGYIVTLIDFDALEQMKEDNDGEEESCSAAGVPPSDELYDPRDDIDLADIKCLSTEPVPPDIENMGEDLLERVLEDEIKQAGSKSTTSRIAGGLNFRP